MNVGVPQDDRAGLLAGVPTHKQPPQVPDITS